MIIEGMRRWSLFILFCVLLPIYSAASTIKTVKSGYWFNPSIWSEGEIPKGYDTIQVNHIVGSDSTIVIFKTVLVLGEGGEVHSPDRVYVDRGAKILNRGAIYTESLEVFGTVESFGKLTTGSTQIAGSFVVKGSWNTRSGNADNWKEKLKKSKHFVLNTFPNPSNGTFKLSLNEIVPFGTITIHDMKGNLVYIHDLVNEKYHAIQLDLISGLYFLKAQIGQEILTKKLVVN